VDARVVCDGAEWIGGYGICRVSGAPPETSPTRTRPRSPAR
jgi:hypothetical protein